VQVFVKFFTKKKVIFFALRVKVKKFKKMKQMPLFAFPHKAWGGVYYAPPCIKGEGFFEINLYSSFYFESKQFVC
jgi:hypothetical protein